MKAIILRSGSSPVHHSTVSGPPKASLCLQGSATGAFSPINSPKSPLRFKTDHSRATGIRRTKSESDIIRTESRSLSVSMKLRALGFPSFPEKIPEVEGDEVDDYGSLIFGRNDVGYAGIWPESGIPSDELGFSGEGLSNGSGDGGCKRKGKTGGENGDKRKQIGEYYREMLKSNPENSLVLRNYGKFLYEVEKDTERAEEYYGRAILASPGDGEVLSLYGELIWETQRDKRRARGYFDQAVCASPDDCMVLGSYAHFMWQADEDEEEEEEEEEKKQIDGKLTEDSSTMIAAC